VGLNPDLPGGGQNEGARRGRRLHPLVAPMQREPGHPFLVDLVQLHAGGLHQALHPLHDSDLEPGEAGLRGERAAKVGEHEPVAGALLHRPYRLGHAAGDHLQPGEPPGPLPVGPLIVKLERPQAFVARQQGDRARPRHVRGR